MNPARRRRATRAHEARQLAAGINAMQEANIVVDIRHFGPEDFIEVKLAAALGSTEATAILEAIRRTVRFVTDAPPHFPALCGCCDAEVLGTAFLIVLASPHGEPLETSVGLATTLCTNCRSNVREHALVAFQRAWPGMRPVTVHAQPEAVQ